MQTQEETRANLTTSSRKIVLIKGYTRFVGRALVALSAIEKLVPYLDGYEIVVYSADPKARRKAHSLAKEFGLWAVSYRRGALSQDQFLELFRQSRI